MARSHRKVSDSATRSAILKRRHPCYNSDSVYGSIRFLGVPMNGETYSIQRLLSLRKLTRAIADLLRAELKDYLSALAPLFRPRNVLGDYVQGASKEGTRGSE